MVTRRTFLAGATTALSLGLSGCMYQMSEEDSDYIATYNFQQSKPRMHIRFVNKPSDTDLDSMAIEHDDRGVWDTTELHPDLTRQSVEYPRDQTPEEIEEHKLVLYDTHDNMLEEHYLVLPERMRNPRR